MVTLDIRGVVTLDVRGEVTLDVRGDVTLDVRGVVTLEGDNLLVFYYFSPSEICHDKRMAFDERCLILKL